MKKFLKAMVFGCLMLSSLVGCDKEETNNQTNNNNTNNTTENNNNNNTVEAKLTGITLNAESVKKAYTYGDALDLTGLVVNANYDDNTSKAVTSYTTAPADGAALNSVGNVPVTVTYEGKTASFNVSVTKGLTGITLNTDAVKKVYNHNETLDLTGLVVTANYNDNTSEVVSTYTTDPANGSALDAVGNKTITVTYEGKTNTFDITVNAVLTGITLNTDNVKKDYKHKEKLDLTDLKVFANYSDGTSREVTNFTTDPANGTTLDTVGNNRINVTYEGFTEFFGVNVAKKILRITLDTTNVKTVYRDGEQLDLTGLVVTAFYSDNTSEDVSAYATTNYPDGHTFEVYGNIQVVVGYAGVSAKFDCTCPPFSEEGTTVTVNLDRDISFGKMGVPNNAYISARGTKGSNYTPTMSLYRRSTAEGSMTHVNGATRFLNGDSIENITGICGITKITVHGGNGYFNLYVGYRNDSLHKFLISESNNGDRIFDNIPNVNYFMLRGTHDDFPADISSIEIEYTRDENHAEVPGVAKTIDQVTVVNNTYTLGSNVITVSGNTAMVNGDEYIFVGIEYLGYILYKSHTGKGILVKFKGTTEIEVIDVDSQYGGFTGTYSKIIPATSITLSMNLNTVAENSPSSRFNMTTRDFFAFSASCNASPAETPSIKLVDETNGDADPVVGTYTLRSTISVTDAFYTVEDFELSVNPIVVTKVGDNYKVSYVDVDNNGYTSHSGNYDAEYKNNKLIISSDDGFNVTINLTEGKVEFEYYNEDDYVFLMGDMAYNFVSSSKPTATLDNGLVRAVSAGDFYLEALTSNGIAARYYVHVSEYVPAMLTVDTTPLTLNIGDTHNINPSISANATKPGVAYESSNGNVAYVSADGVITASAAGTATIYVVTMDDTKTIEVTVNGVSQPVGVSYTFDDDNGDSHTVSVIENDSLNIDGTYQFVYLNTESAYVYENDASVKVTIRDAGGAIYLEIVDDNQVIFGYQEGCGVCSYNTDQFELTEVEEQNNSSSGNTTNNSSTTNTSTNNGGTSNASTNTGAEISQGNASYTSLPTSRTTLYFLNKDGKRNELEYIPNAQIFFFKTGLVYTYDTVKNTYRDGDKELTLEIKNCKLVLKSNKPFNNIRDFLDMGIVESVTEIEVFKK